METATRNPAGYKEEEILEELRHDSRSAFEYVFKTYYASLCRYAEEILKDPQQSEDVVISLFLIIWDTRHKLTIHTSLNSYLYRSTYNACMNVLRKKKTEDKYRDFCIHHSDSSKTNDYGSSSYPLSDIVEKEMFDRIRMVIDSFSPQCKKIFLLSRVENYSHHEIAEKLDISVNTVKVHISNALRIIRTLLKDILYILVMGLSLLSIS
jgi:RNA polymerase sigma-70 factor, ECF subfamily